MTVPEPTPEHTRHCHARLLAEKYASKPMVILASGPSLSAVQIATAQHHHARGDCYVMTINQTYQRFPNADIRYTNDHDWLALNIDRMRGLIVCGYPGFSDPRALSVPFDRRARGLRSTVDPFAIAWGGNSGAAGISLAVLCGARRILLAGFDQQGEHWHEPHPESVRKPANFPMWARWFAQAARDAEREGIEILNCSHETSLTCFRRSGLREELSRAN